MKKIIYLAVIVVTLTSCWGINTIFPKGKRTKESKTIESFDKISVSSGIDLILSEAAEGVKSVEIEAYENIQDNIEVYISNNCLIIRTKNLVSLGGIHKTKAYVSAHYIKSIDAAGGCDIELNNILVSDNLSVVLSGGSKIEGNIKCDALDMSLSGGSKAELGLNSNTVEVNTSGGSSVEINGAAETMNLTQSGGGRLRGSRFSVNNLHLNLSGGSTASILANNVVTGVLSGGSRLTYRGDASTQDVSLSGGSNISHER